MPAMTVETTAAECMVALLHRAIELDASDLHLVAGNPPAFRVHGRLRSTDAPAIDASRLNELIRSILPDHAREAIDRCKDADFALPIDVNAAARRFRVNVFFTRGSLGLSARLLMAEIPTFEWAGFPVGVAARIAEFRNGLVLFTGITGSGKSTSLAVLIEMLNERGGYRIITLEDPIEYVYEPRPDTVISQREVGIDVESFAAGLKFGLRQDPDVILVGEIRDRETAQLAITAAETGHLVLSTMHTRDAAGAITRIVDMFPQHGQNDIRTQLAMSLRCIVSQHLLPPAVEGEHRQLAVEVLFNNLPVASAIRFGKTEAISDAILAGRSDGMISLDECLNSLVQTQAITREVALCYANNPQRFPKSVSKKAPSEPRP